LSLNPVHDPTHRASRFRSGIDRLQIWQLTSMAHFRILALRGFPGGNDLAAVSHCPSSTSVGGGTLFFTLRKVIRFTFERKSDAREYPDDVATSLWPFCNQCTLGELLRLNQNARHSNPAVADDGGGISQTPPRQFLNRYSQREFYWQRGAVPADAWDKRSASLPPQRRLCQAPVKCAKNAKPQGFVVFAGHSLDALHGDGLARPQTTRAIAGTRHKTNPPWLD
jgi:hypothetical protein